MKYDKNQWLAFTCHVLNTYDPYYKQPELLGNLEQLKTLLNKYDLFEGVPVSIDDLQLTRSYRDQLKKHIAMENDYNLVQILNDFEQRSPIQSRLQIKADRSFDYMYEQYADKEISVADRISAIGAFTLGRVLVEYGRERLKICASPPCEDIYVDQSKNGQQRFCSKRCSTRFHVKKHRQSNEI
ncbi:CGNR zinc finger domain-containing protein [Paenibacillus popilliae]|uniref:CGNR zinc finger domain-containing protein n=1 Tax=Paenibacillus popilliae TaxID=78057 RepID=A0ABY3B0U8_PAEPP|nr:CGNR zinc finger domain-containing protein [Paenibacillus sp. SDF0028]TQR47120.1 CGNR zinc finger domain-containing protein [Paenibacillus sp. SDF0028]